MRSRSIKNQTASAGAGSLICAVDAVLVRSNRTDVAASALPFIFPGSRARPKTVKPAERARGQWRAAKADTEEGRMPATTRMKPTKPPIAKTSEASIRDSDTNYDFKRYLVQNTVPDGQ